MKNPSKPARSRKAFTLIELLIVIVIVAALSSLVFALSSKALRKARSAKCINNMRDWSMVFNTASLERNGRLDLPDNWAAVSGLPYDPDSSGDQGQSPFLQYWDTDIENARQIQFEKRGCPLIRNEAPDNEFGNPAATYRMNLELREEPSRGNRNPYPEVNLTRLKRASTKIIFIDGYYTGNLTLEKGDIKNELIPASEVHGNGKVHAVFADMHVEAVNVSDIESQWDRYIKR
ncbi:hypothetical protein HAHE_18260 [Haloferula helveola]|uniref:Prepilin-type N-terminal cleavage/methylation domain-containing protein n=1 Tax=Haloferula helveola TaxID=490095 RepID=A0ABM7RF61_9BACT|nr:hypothetical protein HAHE_18260 [Haloferula helveola]